MFLSWSHLTKRKDWCRAKAWAASIHVWRQLATWKEQTSSTRTHGVKCCRAIASTASRSMLLFIKKYISKHKSCCCLIVLHAAALATTVYSRFNPAQSETTMSVHHVSNSNACRFDQFLHYSQVQESAAAVESVSSRCWAASPSAESATAGSGKPRVHGLKSTHTANDQHQACYMNGQNQMKASCEIGMDLGSAELPALGGGGLYNHYRFWATILNISITAAAS